MTKKQCPLGEDCDLELVCSCSLTAAWMACAVKSAAKAQDQIKAQAAEIERLRGDLKKAQGALHQIAGKKDYADDPWDIARATLAELTGAQKDGH